MFEINTIKMKNNKRFGKIYRLPRMMENKYWICVDYDTNPDKTLTFTGLVSCEAMENVSDHSTYFTINNYHFNYSNQNIKRVSAAEARSFVKIYESNPMDVYKIHIATAVYNYYKELSTVKFGKTYKIGDMIPGVIYHIAQGKHITNYRFICLNNYDAFPVYASGYTVTGKGESKQCVPTILTETADKDIIGKAVDVLSYSDWLLMLNTRYNRNDKFIPEITLK